MNVFFQMNKSHSPNSVCNDRYIYDLPPKQTRRNNLKHDLPSIICPVVSPVCTCLTCDEAGFCLSSGVKRAFLAGLSTSESAIMLQYCDTFYIWLRILKCIK